MAAALSLTPTSASAEACDKMVPEGGVDLFVMFLPEIIVILIATAAFYADARAGLAAAAIVAVAYIALHIVGTEGDVQAMARAEGCAAPRLVAPALAGALILFLLGRAFRTRADPRSRP